MEQFYREDNPDIRFGIGKKSNFPPHIHEDLELVGIIRGGTTARCDGVDYPMTTGDLLLVGPNQIHSFTDTQPDSQAIVLILKPMLLGDYGEFFVQNIPTAPVFHSELQSDVWKLLYLAHGEFSCHREQTLLRSLLMAFFGLLRRQLKFGTYANAEGSSTRAVLHYCATHYKEEISVDTVARELYLSRSYISRIFNEKLKISFPAYINSLRVTEAARLLESTQYTVTQAAAFAGFATIRSFNRAFRERYGITPSAYAKRGRNHEEMKKIPW